MADPGEILENAFRRAGNSLDKPFIRNQQILNRVNDVARNLSNRAGARLLLSCALAKIHRPAVDIRKPYTEIGDADTFSGRAEYDEKYVWPFAAKYQLPVNATTAFLTPGFRTINVPLALPLAISGRPKQMYIDTIQLLDDVHQEKITAELLLVETIRQLLLLKQEQEERMAQLLQELQTTASGIPLSVEEIVQLIAQHLASPRTSRLPVLIIAAAYQVVGKTLGESVRPLYAHNAADEQTGAIGDVEIMLIGENKLITCYEMKAKDVTTVDADLALQKIVRAGIRVDSYIFITTAPIDNDVAEYVKTFYRKTNGIEFAILDCVGFLRHFLHLFHRVRQDFLNAYQSLVLAEPESAVSQPVKELFLTLRRVTEFDKSND